MVREKNRAFLIIAIGGLVAISALIVKHHFSRESLLAQVKNSKFVPPQGQSAKSQQKLSLVTTATTTQTRTVRDKFWVKLSLGLIFAYF